MKYVTHITAGSPGASRIHRTFYPKLKMLTENRSLYEFAVVRFVPRVERDEFFNIGLIMMCKRRRWLRVEFHINPQLIAAFGATDHAD
ncbi:MAG: DUF3037 domain-containing protein, partial [Muribaculaceae bacterium]|nr:DUF3037 domain-containing protein [Muribaculaceae bacterium]